MTLPVYIDGRKRTARVDLHGQALRIAVEGRAVDLVPLGRTDRILCYGGVWWHADALRACGRAGIPVAFTHPGDARPRTLLMPAAARDRSLTGLVEEASLTPGWSARLADWEAHERSRPQGPRRRQARRAAAPSGPLGWRSRMKRLASLHDLWLRRRLTDVGLGPEFQGASSSRPDLAARFASARRADLDELARRLADSEGPAAPSGEGHADAHERLFAVFESAVPDLEMRFAATLARFERMVRDLVEGEGLWDG